MELTVIAHGGNGATMNFPPRQVRLLPAAGLDVRGPLAGGGSITSRLNAPARAATGRRRVCVLTHSLRLGGGELYLQELLLRLVDADFADFLVVSPEDGPLRAELESRGVVVHVGSEYPTDPARYYARLTELGQLMRGWGTEVVLANTLGVFGAVDAALDIDLPVIWALHESFPLDVFSYLNWGSNGLHPDIDERWRSALSRSNEVIFESDATLKLYAEQVPDLNGRRVRYGIDLGEIERYRQTHNRAELRHRHGFADTDRVLLCMGVLQERKSQLALVHSFAQLALSQPDTYLVLVGYHPSAYSQAVCDYICDAGLSDRVRLLGIDPDTYQWYYCADVLVSASDTESLPRSVLEALAFGVPVLAADVFGLSEVIRDGHNGWLFEARSGNSLTAGLKRVLGTSAETLTQISMNCREDALVYDGVFYAREYKEMINQLAASGDAA
jgi:glycosyltransferase involved in cell wall biosynthesis